MKFTLTLDFTHPSPTHPQGQDHRRHPTLGHHHSTTSEVKDLIVSTRQWMPFLLCALIRETEPFECTVYMNHVGFVFTEIMVGEDKRHLWELWHMDRERECTECTSRTQVGNCLWACSLKDRNARSTCTGRWALYDVCQFRSNDNIAPT